jgi:hypothetical protein
MGDAADVEPQETPAAPTARCSGLARTKTLGGRELGTTLRGYPRFRPERGRSDGDPRHRDRRLVSVAWASTRPTRELESRGAVVRERGAGPARVRHPVLAPGADASRLQHSEVCPGDGDGTGCYLGTALPTRAYTAFLVDD